MRSAFLLPLSPSRVFNRLREESGSPSFHGRDVRFHQAPVLHANVNFPLRDALGNLLFVEREVRMAEGPHVSSALLHDVPNNCFSRLFKCPFKENFINYLFNLCFQLFLGTDHSSRRSVWLVRHPCSCPYMGLESLTRTR